MELWNYSRENVILTLNNGSQILGFVQEYCDREDNEEGIDSICLRVGESLYEYFETEILDISII